MTFTQCKDYIRSDYYRSKGSDTNSILKLYYASILNVGFRSLFWFRLTKCNNLFVQYLSRAILMHMRMKHKIDIDRNTNIGYGFRLPHGGPVVINVSAVIGDNVDMYQYSTIGSMTCNAAKIGNDVYIGPSVCIVENVHIGDGVTIGAGSVVVKDVEAGMTVAGNPAGVISHKKSGRLIWRKWNKEWNNYKG